MGQITFPSSGQINVAPTDRETGPGAGAGSSGNRSLFLGAAAGLNAAQSDLIALGNNAMSGGVTDANLAGTITIGSQAGKALVNAVTGNANTVGPNLIVGFNAGTLNVNISTCVLLGPNVLATYVGSSAAAGSSRASTIIGASAMQLVTGTPGNEVPPSNLVVIGHRALYGSGGTGFGSYQTSVIIGKSACETVGGVGTGTGFGITDCVVIGSSAASALGNGAAGAGANTLIGANTAQSLTAGNNNTLIGANCTISSTISNAVAVGNAITNINNSGVYLGSAIDGSGAGQRSILIGSLAASSIADDQFIVETNVSATHRAVLYGNLGTGNLVVGKSTFGTDRDLQGTNALKIINGTAGASPIGGGYFYVNAGRLRWVDSNGVETAISVNAAGQLSNTTTAYTNNAAAAVATITNGPTAGNPTKWIPINDAGTIRNIPAW